MHFLRSAQKGIFNAFFIHTLHRPSPKFEKKKVSRIVNCFQFKQA